MRRIAPLLQWTLVVALALIGYVALQPSPPAASAYPTALDSYDAPTAWSNECQFPQHCQNGEYCVPSEDPYEGCQYNPGYPPCLGCYI